MEQLGNSRKSGCVKSNSAVAEEGQNAAAKLNREGRITKVTRILSNALTGQMLVLAVEQPLQTSPNLFSKAF